MVENETFKDFFSSEIFQSHEFNSKTRAKLSKKFVFVDFSQLGDGPKKSQTQVNNFFRQGLARSTFNQKLYIIK